MRCRGQSANGGGAAVESLPDMEPVRQLATGTDGRPADHLRQTCAERRGNLTKGGENGNNPLSSKSLETVGKPHKIRAKRQSASWRNWQTQWIQNPSPIKREGSSPSEAINSFSEINVAAPVAS